MVLCVGVTWCGVSWCDVVTIRNTGQKPHFAEPVVLRQGATVKDVCLGAHNALFSLGLQPLWVCQTSTLGLPDQHFSSPLLRTSLSKCSRTSAHTFTLSLGAASSDVGCALVDAGCALVDAGCALVDAGCALVDVGCALVDAGCFDLLLRG
jgi:hypothetical protein